MIRFADVETPYRGKNKIEMDRNILYARACVRDCLLRGEIPFASHLFFTQPGILDDNIKSERKLGINAGKILIEAIPDIITVVYKDFGITRGMRYGIKRAAKKGRNIEYRVLGNSWEEKALKRAEEHSHAILWGLNCRKFVDTDLKY